MGADFEDEIFISYSHLDNNPPKEGLDGWITRFHKRLETRVNEVRGQRARIFRDPKLQGNDDFSGVLVDRLKKTGVLVSIFSEGYLRSQWCSKELTEFCTALKQTGTLVVGDHKTRVFKVSKTKLPLDRMPEDVQPLIGYDFFRIDEKGRPQELDELYGPDSEHEFWARLNDLAYDIADLLQFLETGPENNAGRPAVYLAETTLDLRDNRDAIRRDLQRHGYTVLPDRNLPLVSDDLESFLKSELNRSKVSVHLLGSAYGIVPEGTDESLAVIQNRIARDFGKAGALTRLIWITDALANTDTRQKSFLEQVRTDPGLDEGADVLETPFEELKTVLYERLKAAEKPPAPAITPAADKTSKQIYLVSEQRDREAVKPLRDYLRQQGFEVIPTLFEGTEEELRSDHEGNLRCCDAVLIYWGQGSPAWQRQKFRDATTTAALGRPAPPLASVVVAPPASDSKDDFASNTAIRMPDGFTPDLLRDFIAQLQISERRAGA